MEPMEVQSPIVESDDTSPIEHAINQAAVFLEDAAKYRSIHHKMDSKSLWMYRLYYSKPVRWGFTLIIFLNLMLAFVEKPSSFTSSSDPRFRAKRPDPPCGVTESLELFFLICFVCDLVVKSHVLGRQEFIKSRWLLCYCLVLTISFIDVFVSLSTGCSEAVRIRRLLRPFFLIQNSSLMKKLLRAIRRTVPEILSVLFLLVLHLWFFAMCGMLLFPQSNLRKNSTLAETECGSQRKDLKLGLNCEGYYYFSSFEVSLRSLLVLLTTANNPDVMMHAYMKNRWYAVFFVTFTIVGLYFFLNLLTAVIYNQFRGFLTSSLQASFFRRRVGIRAAFEVLLQIQDTDSDLPLGTISTADARQAIERAKIGSRGGQRVLYSLTQHPTGHLTAKQFQDLFDVLDKGIRRRARPAMSFVENRILRKVQIFVSNKLFDYTGDFVAAVNVLLVSVLLDYEQDTIWVNRNSHLAIANLIFVLYYLFEQLLKLWAVGWQRYRSSLVNIYCGAITMFLVVIEIVHVSLYGSPFTKSDDGSNERSSFHLRNLTQVINILITFRLLRIVPHVRALRLILKTLLKLLKNLRPFAGIIVAFYYIFAIFGMMLFNGVTDPSNVGANKTRMYVKECGSFDQLQYYANNFDDFFAALVVLWDLMVVNNWHVFLKEYANVVSAWSQLYFIAWYLTSVILIINLFVALILEAFISQWETKQQELRENSQSVITEATMTGGGRFHQLFSSGLVEPAEAELLNELRGHHHHSFQSSEATPTVNTGQNAGVSFHL